MGWAKSLAKKTGLVLARVLATAALVSASLALVHALFRGSLDLRRSTTLFMIVLGIASGLIFFSLVSHFNRAYVFGHEFSHWLAAKFFRRATSEFHAGKDGGSVQVESPNIWIALAPYVIPIYTLIWLVVVAVGRIWFRPPWLPTFACLGVGFTYAHHVVLNVLALSKGQKDLTLFGPVLSLALVIAANLAILYFALNYAAGALGRSLTPLAQAYSAQWRLARLVIDAF